MNDVSLRTASPAPTVPTPENAAEKRGLERAAHEFESLFTMRLVEAMRKPSDEEGGQQGGMMDHLMNQSLAGHLSKGRGLGIASFLYRQWTGDDMSAVSPSGSALASRWDAAASGGLGGAPNGSTPPNVPDVQYDPESIDDGTRPLRDMIPPTGLEDQGPLSKANESSMSISKKPLYGQPYRPDLAIGALPRLLGEKSWT